MNDKHTPYADHWGLRVRRIKDGLNLVCQEFDGTKWVEFARVDEMSNDYAYTDSAGWCRQRATKYIGGH